MQNTETWYDPDSVRSNYGSTIGGSSIRENSALLQHLRRKSVRRKEGWYQVLRQDVWMILHYRASIYHKSIIEKASYAVEVFILNLILLNVIVTIWTSLQVSNYVDSTGSLLKDSEWYYFFLIFSTGIFTLEYILRFWSCVEDPRFEGPIIGRLAWVFRPMSLLDLVALVPFYFEFFLTEREYKYRGAMSVRALRLLRVVSFLRIERSYKAMKKLRKIFSKKREELLIVTFITAVVILISGTTIFFLEYAAQPEVFSNVAAGAWWSVETITSLGYGDMVPSTTAGKIFGCVVALWGIVLFSIPGAILNSGFVEVMLEHQKKKELMKHEKMIQQISSQRGVSFLQLIENMNPTELSSIAMQQGGARPSFDEQSTPRLISPMVSTRGKSTAGKGFADSDERICEKMNALIENQRLMNLQLEFQREQLNTLISILRRNGLSDYDDEPDDT